MVSAAFLCLIGTSMILASRSLRRLPARPSSHLPRLVPSDCRGLHTRPLLECCFPLAYSRSWRMPRRIGFISERQISNSGTGARPFFRRQPLNVTEMGCAKRLAGNGNAPCVSVYVQCAQTFQTIFSKFQFEKITKKQFIYFEILLQFPGVGRQPCEVSMMA